MAERYNNIRTFEELSSTNDYACDLLRHELVSDFTVIQADYQTKGRGQRGNSWVSNPRENLLFSIILHPNHISAEEQFILSQAVSLALYETVNLFCENVHIKWPNDIYVRDNKIAGILIENMLEGKHITSSVVGIGLNVNQVSFADVPNPTSLYVESGCLLQRDEVLYTFLVYCQEYYTFIQTKPEYIRQQYNAVLYRKDVMSSYIDTGGMFRGEIKYVAPNGRLHIIDEYGRVKKYYFKEVAYVL